MPSGLLRTWELDLGLDRRDLGAQQFDAAKQITVRQSRIRHLQRQSAHTAQLLADSHNLLGHRLRVPHEERAVGTGGGVELVPAGPGEPALPGDLGEHLVPARVDGVCRVLGGLGDMQKWEPKSIKMEPGALRAASGATVGSRSALWEAQEIFLDDIFAELW